LACSWASKKDLNMANDDILDKRYRVNIPKKNINIHLMVSKNISNL
jgi:hypothetical protein